MEFGLEKGISEGKSPGIAVELETSFTFLGSSSRGALRIKSYGHLKLALQNWEFVQVQDGRGYGGVPWVWWGP